MPHDKNGKRLSVGSIVMLACVITAINPSETQCNVTAEALERPEGESFIPTIAGNSRFYELADAAAPLPPKSLRECAEEAYSRYGAVTDYKNFRGDPMPAFVDLPLTIQKAWEAAINIGECTVTLNKIDPTADGLKA